MSDFVDFNKRSVDLPPGCKDLGDVLARRRKKTERGVPAAGGTGWAQDKAGLILGKLSREEAVGTLADLAKYCAKMFDTPDKSASVQISLQVKPIGACLRKRFDGTVEASVQYEAREDLDRVMRSFLDRHDLLPPRASLDSPNPAQFLPHVPFYILCDLVPAPSNALRMLGLIGELLREVGGAGENTELRFRYFGLRAEE